MNNQELLKAIETLLTQGQNNYYLSDNDIEQAERALQTMNNHLKNAKSLQTHDRNEY